MRLGRETGSLVNHMLSNVSGAPTPEVGLGVTVLCWTDRVPGTITELLPNGGFVVTEDDAKRTDSNGMSESQTYDFTPNPNGRTFTFKRVTRGKAKGQMRENGSVSGNAVLVGRREKYHDFSF